MIHVNDNKEQHDDREGGGEPRKDSYTPNSAHENQCLIKKSSNPQHIKIITMSLSLNVATQHPNHQSRRGVNEKT